MPLEHARRGQQRRRPRADRLGGQEVRHRGPGTSVPDHVVACPLVHDHREAGGLDGVPQGLPSAMVVGGFDHGREHGRPQAECGDVLHLGDGVIEPPRRDDPGASEARGLPLELVVDPVVVDPAGDPTVVGVLQHPDVEPDGGKDALPGNALLAHDPEAMLRFEDGQAIGFGRTGLSDVGPVEDQRPTTVLGRLDALHGPLPHGGRQVRAPQVSGFVHVRVGRDQAQR